jgi:hypothetical protein
MESPPAGEADGRVYAVDRRKELYELLFPTTANGGDRRSTSSQLLRSETEVERFTLNTAKATGKSERAIQDKKPRPKARLTVIKTWEAGFALKAVQRPRQEIL